MFDDGLADVSVAQRVRHVGVGEIERPGARFRIEEGGFLAVDGGEEPAAAGVVADVELHGVGVPRRRRHLRAVTARSRASRINRW